MTMHAPFPACCQADISEYLIRFLVEGRPTVGRLGFHSVQEAFPLPPSRFRDGEAASADARALSRVSGGMFVHHD
jgi:hypothetical protein